MRLYPHTRVAIKCFGAVADANIALTLGNPFAGRNIANIMRGIQETEETDYAKAIMLARSNVQSSTRVYAMIIEIVGLCQALDNNLKFGKQKELAINEAGCALQDIIGRHYGCWHTVQTKNFDHEVLRLDTGTVNLLFQFLDDFVWDIGEST